MRLDLDRLLKDHKIGQVVLHASYDNGTSIDEYDVSIEDLHKILTKMDQRDGLVPIEGD